MFKLKHLGVIALVLVVAGLALFVLPASAATHTFTGSFALDGDQVTSQVSLTAGEVTVTCSEIGDGHVHVAVMSGGVTLNPTPGFTDMCCWVPSTTFTAPVTGTYDVLIYNYWDGGVDYTVTITDTAVAPVSVPGCDTRMNITSSSVVGAFVANAPVYSSPGALASPAVTLQAGKTAWVLGKDASGQYYKIVWACDYLWVPVGTMGPNPDAVWRNAPLPTGVVK